jgi:hypothetical protein
MIRVVVVVDVAQQQAGLGSVHNQADVETHANRPEVGVFRFIELVELQRGMSRIQLEIEGRGLYRLLFVAGEFGKAVSERVCDAVFHLLGSSQPIR